MSEEWVKVHMSKEQEDKFLDWLMEVYGRVQSGQYDQYDMAAVVCDYVKGAEWEKE